MIKNLAVGAVAVVALITGVVNYNGINHLANQPAKVVERLGSVASPDIQSPYIAVSGVKSEYRRTSLTSATTTVCAIQAPTYATSTLVMGSVTFTTTATTTAQTPVTLAKASTPYATTTSLGLLNLRAGDTGTVLASTTGAQANVFSPGQYFVVGVQGGTVPNGNSRYSAEGVCQAEFLVNL